MICEADFEKFKVNEAWILNRKSFSSSIASGTKQVPNLVSSKVVDMEDEIFGKVFFVPPQRPADT
jgi:hypothetical protein